MKNRRGRAVPVIIGLMMGFVLAAVLGYGPYTAGKSARAQEPTVPPSLPAEKQPVESGPPPSMEPVILPPAKEVDRPTTVVKTLDPDEDAEQFVAKTKKEAATRIASLEKEAGDLRIKLAKIEAATNRIKNSMASLLEPTPDKAAEEPVLMPGEPPAKPKQP